MLGKKNILRGALKMDFGKVLSHDLSGKYGLALCPKENRINIGGQLFVAAMQSIHTTENSKFYYNKKENKHFQCWGYMVSTWTQFCPYNIKAALDKMLKEKKSWEKV